MPVDGLVQQLAAVVQEAAHDTPVEGKVDLVEADCSHGQSVHLLAEALDEQKLLTAELAVAVQHAQFDHHLDEVLNYLLRLLAVARVLLGSTVQLIQHVAARVIDKQVGHRLGSHLAHKLLLGLQGQVLRAEGIHVFWKQRTNGDMIIWRGQKKDRSGRNWGGTYFSILMHPNCCLDAYLRIP